jgi:aminoglycoside phosphotransferase (APT) family kinase protein
MTPRLGIFEVLEVVRSSVGADVEYLRCLTGGQTVGAHLVRFEGDSVAVLKFGWNGGWLGQIERAAATAETLRARGYPTPPIGPMGLLPGAGWWYVQGFVEGEHVPVAAFTPTHFDALIDLVRTHRGLAPPTDQDWSGYVVGLVLHHDHDWQVLLTAGPVVDDFLNRVKGRVEPLAGVVLGHDDLVLGDIGPHNMLFRDGRLVGVIDFESAGRGDLLYDVASLVYRFRDQPVDRGALLELAAGRGDAYKLCATANVLSGLNFALGQGTPAAVAVQGADDALEFHWHQAAIGLS